MQSYNLEMEMDADYLMTRSSAKVMKAITKLQKEHDKAVLSESEEAENE